jgi:Na+-transporting NADH:ubiquinone oxidoreductase subunit C
VQHSNAYTYRFAAIVTIICSVLLSGAATLLKPFQEQNEIMDIRKNILASVGIKPQGGKKFSHKEVEQLYHKTIKELVINNNGDIVEGVTPSQIDPKKETGKFPVYEKVEDGKLQALVIPVSGKGLWSTIYGYMALEPDCRTVMGVEFYKNGETPGLGAEIANEWFTSQFKGKKISDENGNLVSITIVKGKVKDHIPAEDAWHYVDGISGATLTGRGITKFLKKDLRKYQPFLKKILAQKEANNE